MPPQSTTHHHYGATAEESQPLAQADHDHDNAATTTTTTTSTTSPMGPPSHSPIWIKTQANFWDDLMEFRPGSIPHSMVLAVSIGVISGTAAWLYYAALEFMLEYGWKTLPEQLAERFADSWSDEWHFLWIPLLGVLCAALVGCTVRYMGEPGDLPYTIRCVHEKAFVSLDHVLPMVAASQFSIVGGGSLGPEAPLVAICAALGGAVSRHLYGTTDRNLVRKHTLMGMAGALAAFFGCPLGGSLFALEVNSRFGVEYFEHTLEAILCGEVCLGVFRALARLPIAPIWDFRFDGTTGVLEHGHVLASTPMEVVYGMALGLVGAAIAALFAVFHRRVMGMFRQLNLIDPQGLRAIPRALLGSSVIITLGILVPQTMFWGEYEIQSIGTLAPTSKLPHIWPANSSVIGFEMNSCFTSFVVGVTKLIAISFTVAGGYRGGYIFPAFAAGCAFGRAIHFLFPDVSLQLCMMCMAAAINVGLTRTAMATTLILAFLSGEQLTMSPILAASLVSLFATGYMPFIPSQQARADMGESIFEPETPVPVHDAHLVSSLKQKLRKQPADEEEEKSTVAVV